MERKRSPNHPRISLEEAVDLVRKLGSNGLNGRSFSDDEMASAWNTKTSSGIFQAGSTGLRQYGLIVSTRNDEHSLTETASTMLKPASDREDYIHALLTAALSPEAFRMTRNILRHMPITKREVESLLQKEGFTPPAASRVLRIVQENDSYIESEAKKMSSHGESGKEMATDSPSKLRLPPAKDLTGSSSSRARIQELRRSEESVSIDSNINRRPGSYSYPLSKGNTVRVIFANGLPNSRDVDMLIRYLGILSESINDEMNDVPF